MKTSAKDTKLIKEFNSVSFVLFAIFVVTTLS